MGSGGEVYFKKLYLASKTRRDLSRYSETKGARRQEKGYAKRRKTAKKDDSVWARSSQEP